MAYPYDWVQGQNTPWCVLLLTVHTLWSLQHPPLIHIFMSLETGTLAEGILTPCGINMGTISAVGENIEGYQKDPHCAETTSITNHNQYSKTPCLVGQSGMFWLHRGYNVHCSPQFGIFGFLHCGEFTITSSQDLKQARHLCMKNIVFYPSFDHPTSMTVHLKYSKTDPFGHGHTLTLFVTGQKTCPVMTMHTYFKVRGFCLEAPLFILADNRPLTCTSFVTMLRVALGKLGLDSTLYASHSFRIGAATTAAAAGLPDWLIQALDRWSSACYLRYICIPLTSLNQASTTLANASNVW